MKVDIKNEEISSAIAVNLEKAKPERNEGLQKKKTYKKTNSAEGNKY